MSDCEKRLKSTILEIYMRSKLEANYVSRILLEMLDRRGAVSTAKYFINHSQPSAGFIKLHERNRLDLTIEAAVVEDRLLHELFSSNELERAAKRLKLSGYNTEIVLQRLAASVPPAHIKSHCAVINHSV